MEAYSLDLQKRVLAARDAGHGTKEVAKLFDVSPSVGATAQATPPVALLLRRLQQSNYWP